jgi:hypothetical protein
MVRLEESLVSRPQPACAARHAANPVLSGSWAAPGSWPALGAPWDAAHAGGGLGHAGSPPVAGSLPWRW